MKQNVIQHINKIYFMHNLSRIKENVARIKDNSYKGKRTRGADYLIKENLYHKKRTRGAEALWT